MGHAAGSEFKAQMDLGTLVPYKSNNHESCHRLKFYHVYM